MKPARKENELNFKKIIESSREGILIVDAEGTILFANPAAHVLLNQKNSDLIGKSFGRPLEDDAIVEMGIVRLSADSGAGEMRFSETVWEGKKAYLILLLDVTELKRAKEDLLKINEELEKRVEERTSQLSDANQELERFAYIASHDLQEPLRKIITYGEALGGHEALDSQVKDYIQRMAKSAQGMKHLVESLLQFSRLPHEFSMEECDLNEIMKEVVASLELKISQSKATVSYASLACVQANKAQMNHIFQNLLENAIKFARKGVSPYIRVVSKSNKADVEISVIDNGIGIEVKYAQKIFEPFQRLHSKSDYEGSGIGLSIVKKIVENHNGTVRVESAHPSGSVFILTLPRTNCSKT